MDIAATKKRCEAATARLKEFARLRATTEVEAALAQTDIDALADPAALEALEEAQAEIDHYKALWEEA